MRIEEILAGSEDEVATATIDGVRLIIFNRPAARNALSRAMRRRFALLLADAGQDSSVGCIVVTGAHGAFTAGSDIRESRAQPGPMVRPHPGEALRACTRPVIAAIDGPCITGGLEIALSCSFAIASDRSVFADTHAKIGILPAWGQSALLPRAIGAARARQMMATGAFVDASTALAWGLVNEVTTPEELLPRALDLGRAITGCDRRSIDWQMRLIADHHGAPMAEALAAEEAAVVRWRAGEKHYAPATGGAMNDYQRTE
nr:enoyl-CoA hydratase-related protein [Sphingomonas sp. Y57]